MHHTIERLPTVITTPRPIRSDPEAPAPIDKIPFPLPLQQFLKDDPKLIPLAQEMDEKDPHSFLHDVMVADCYLRIAHKYTESVARTQGERIAREVERVLAEHLPGVFFHDIGKWAVHPDPKTAYRIINDPINPLDRSTDNRTGDLIALHRLHPKLGGMVFGQLDSSGKDPHGENRKRKNAGLIFSHHENDIPGAVALDGKVLFSYPREGVRFHNNMDDLAHLFLRLADSAIASGQPRPYKHRLSDTYVFSTLEILLSDKKIEKVFGGYTPGETILIRGALISMTMEAMKTIQDDYPIPLCNHPPGFDFSPLERYVHPTRDYLPLSAITEGIWKRHGGDLRKAMDRRSVNGQK